MEYLTSKNVDLALTCVMDSLEEWGIVVDQTRVSCSRRMGKDRRNGKKKNVEKGGWRKDGMGHKGIGMRKRGKSVSERSFDAQHRHSTPLCLSFLFSLSLSP